jgi:hypothetical protein
MTDPQDLIEEVGVIVTELANLGLRPVLVGGMALVVLGSRRVTRDFDFVIAQPKERLQMMLDVFYGRGLELAARINEEGDVTATIDNRRVAHARLTIDEPSSAFFQHPTTGLRIDLLFDFPVPASDLATRAKRTKLRSHVFHVASAEDLLQLKSAAAKGRSVSGDAEDIAYLTRTLRTKPSKPTARAAAARAASSPARTRTRAR